MSPRRDLTESQAGPYRVPGGTLPSPRRDLTMISDERRYGDRIQAHMRWLSCTARECGPAAQRDMDRWVAAYVEIGAVPPVPPQLEALGVKKSLSRKELRKRLRTEGAGRGRTEQAASGKLQNFLKDAALAARCQRWEFRVAEEMRANDGWYCIWASLTFDPHLWDAEDEIRHNRAFDRFALRMAESVRMALSLPQPKDDGPARSTYCRHVAVVEHGASRQHHHIHSLFWCRDVPVEWKVDPNVGRVTPNASQILGCKALWQYDIASKVEPFRFLGDRWTREGWMVPIKEGRPMVLTPPECAGAYLVKYLSKEAKEWNHRVMATRGLGMARVSRFLSSLAPRRLLGLNQHYPVWDAAALEAAERAARAAALGSARSVLEQDVEAVTGTRPLVAVDQPRDIDRLLAHAERRNKWRPALVDGFRGAAVMAFGAPTPPRSERVL